MRVLAAICVAMVLSSCDNKPKHYLVLCDETDRNGWRLTNFVKTDGYLMACTYTAPDNSQSYTNGCDATGCGVK